MLKKDILHAVRSLTRNPGFTLMAVLSLVVGIGANTAIFSVVNAVLLRDLPFPDADRLVSIWEMNPERGWYKNKVAAANFLDWKEQSTLFEDMAAYTEWTFSMAVTGDGPPENVQAGQVTPNYFEVLEVGAAQGRTFLAQDDPSRSFMVVLSHGFWQRRFGGDPEIVGNEVTLSQQKATVLGVMPEGFQHLGGQMDFWTPFNWNPAQTKGSPRARMAHNLRAVGRLKAGVSLPQAESELKAIAAELEKTYPEINRMMGVGLTPLHEWLAGDTRTPLLILCAAVAFVLLIACANIANLILARFHSRSAEFALRSALGAGQWRITRQLLTESLLLSGLGGALGLGLGILGVRFLTSLGYQSIPPHFEVGLDLRVLLFTVLITLLTGALFGLLASLETLRVQPNEALKESGTKSTGIRGARAREFLIVSEVALALLLVIGAGLMLRSFSKLLQVETGFDAERLLTMSVELPRWQYRQSKDIGGFYEKLMTRIGAQPGVESAAATSILRLTGEGWTGDLAIEGRDLQGKGSGLNHSAITPGYFESMKIPLLKGRAFTENDHATAPKVVIINQSMASRYFEDEDPIGHRIAFDAEPGDSTQWWAIVGLVRNERQKRLDQEPEPEVFQPHAQWPQAKMNLIVRSSLPTASIAQGVRRAVAELDPNLPIFNVRTMQEVLVSSLSQKIFITWLLSVFAVLALIQASVGIYGVVAYSVRRRRREIGIRMALGAGTPEVLTMVIRRSMAVVGLGLALGLTAAFFLTSFLSHQLYTVSRFDPLTFVFVPLLLASIGLIACYLPARRAVGLDPMLTLRIE